MTIERYTDGEGGFSCTLPPGWAADRDEEGGLLVSREEGKGLLHLIPFARDGGEPIDPAEELYAFLEDQEIELEEDEVEDIELASGDLMSLCEYATEESDESTYWLIGVATAPGVIVFANYSCPVGEEDAERENVLEILSTLSLLPAG